MRLINVNTLQLEEFVNEADLKYAILSHRWGDQEVSFTDMQSLNDADADTDTTNTIRARKGFTKISKCCEEARRHDCTHAWVDTCCIDKRSSSELSEAINSMYRWYRNSRVCFAYLADVGTDGPEILMQFKSSQWFERGWTLQELIAPSQVIFYNSAWLRFGSKHRLVDELVEATGIAESVLTGHRSVFHFSIAQRMCWAAKRKTTRVEDQAYSLMGIFNVNMAMLYGEGEKAFIRLQEEIIKHSDDASIFAWSGVAADGGGLLASKIEQFVEPSGVTVAKSRVQWAERQPWTMTNQGLSIELPLTPWTSNIYLAILDCHPPSVLTREFVVGIFLQRIQGRQMRRVATEAGDLLIEGKHILNYRDVRIVSAYIKQDELSPQLLSQQPIKHIPLYGMRLLPIPGIDMKQSVMTKAKWDADTGIAELDPGQSEPVARIDLLPYSKSLERIQVDIDFNFRPRIIMAKRVARASGSSIGQKPAIIRGVWDAKFAQTLDWTAECFATNNRPTGDRFEGAIEDSIVENMFLYAVPADQPYSLIHVMHRPRDGSPHILVAELHIRNASFRGRRVWSLGIELFPAEGASPEASNKVMAVCSYSAKLVSRRDPIL